MPNIIDKIKDNIVDWIDRQKENLKKEDRPLDIVSVKISKYLRKHKDSGTIDDFQVLAVYTANKIDCVVVHNNNHFYFMIDVPTEESEADTDLHPDFYKAYDRAMRGI